MSESKNVGVPINVPLFVPSDDVVNEFKDKLPESMQKHVDSGFATEKEIVAFFQWHLMMCELAMNLDEFLNLFRQVETELERQESPIITPPKNSNIIIPNGY